MSHQGGLIAANAEVLRAALVGSNCREDGRNVRESRTLALDFSQGLQPQATEAASATACEQVTTCTVRLGRTRCSATVSAKIDEPPLDRAHEGTFSVFVDCERDVVEMASAQGTSEIARALDLLLKHARAVDLESLCIVPGRQAWSLRVDVKILENDGNVLDACAACALGACKAFRRPEYRLRDDATGNPSSSTSAGAERATIIPLEEREGNRLTVHHDPFTVSFVAFRQQDDAPPKDEGGDGDEDLEMEEDEDEEENEANFVYAIDPTLAEEAIADAIVVMGADTEGNLRLVRKFGGSALPRGDLTLLGRLACVRARELGKHLEGKCKSFDAQVKQDRVRRRLGRSSTRSKSAGIKVDGFKGGEVAMVEMDETALGLEVDDAMMGAEGTGTGAGGGHGETGGEPPAASGDRACAGGGASVPLHVPMGSVALDPKAKAGGGRQREEGGGEKASPTHLRDCFNPEFLRNGKKD